MKIPEHVKTEYFIYQTFYEGFYKSFLMRERGLNDLALAGVFFHLTFKNITTFYIRYHINYVLKGYIEGGYLQQYWNKSFENAKLNDKLDFFYFIIILANESCTND